MKKSISLALAGSLALGTAVPFTGCEQVKENPRTSGAVIGGASGAAAGALIGGEENRWLGALLGGALGAGGGYLIGAQVAKNDDEHKDEAIEASQNAQQNPATAADVSKSSTADLNNDGFVTMDEVVALEKAGLSNDEMIQRLQATGQVFALTPQQEQYLRDQGVSNRVITAMGTMNRTAVPAGASESPSGDVIGRDADTEDSD